MRGGERKRKDKAREEKCAREMRTETEGAGKTRECKGIEQERAKRVKKEENIEMICGISAFG